MSFDINYFNGMSKEKKYEEMLRIQKDFFKNEKDSLANIYNSFALMYAVFGEINWCGFYFMKNFQLVLGPFQGFPACTRIDLGKGVCGTSAINKKTIVVPDVHDFPGHIACDTRSQSEIVVPVIKDGKLIGVLDIDAPVKNRFGELEVQVVNEFLKTIVENTDLIKISGL